MTIKRVFWAGLVALGLAGATEAAVVQTADLFKRRRGTLGNAG